MSKALFLGLWPYLSREVIRLPWLNVSGRFCHSNPYKNHDMQFRPEHTRRTSVLCWGKWSGAGQAWFGIYLVRYLRTRKQGTRENGNSNEPVVLNFQCRMQLTLGLGR